MTLQKFCRRGRIILAVFAILSFISVVPAFSQQQGEKRQLVDMNLPLQWTQGYTLILLDEKDLHAVNDAKEYIEESGGSIAIYSNAKAMLGWVPRTIAPFLVGKHGITSIHYEQVDADALNAQDEISLSLVNFFNSVVTGEVERQYHSLRWQGDPLVNDVLEHPFVNPAEVIKNLEDKHIAWDAELVRTTANGGVFSGYSDSMKGTIACCLFFVESDGTIDSNRYTWTTSARDHVINQCLSGASWWASQGSSNGVSVSFYIFYYSPDSSAMKQGYEPILHSAWDAYLWINAVMANLGFSSGSDVERVTSFNGWMKSWAGTNWAYSCFFAYNPSGAPSTFTDGYFAYACLGGPFIQMLYRNDGWSIYDIWSIFAHETGHIFWACDEYYQAGYGGCTSCAPCSSFRPVTNGNCEHPSCNPGGSVPCMMRHNSNALCSYTKVQVGWQTQILTIQSSSGGTTSPTPGSYTYDYYSSVSVTANPDINYELSNWSGDASGTSNPITILMDRDKTIKANFRRKPKLTIQAGTHGTTNPSPGVYYYATGTVVQVTAVPDTYCVFIMWSESASGSANPVSLTMDSDKSLYAHFHYIYAPIATGRKVLNRTFSQAEYINILSWQANPSNDGLDITKYRIYQMIGTTPTLLVELASSKLEYYHRKAGQPSIQYAIRAVTRSGCEGAPALVTVQ